MYGSDMKHGPDQKPDDRTVDLSNPENVDWREGWAQGLREGVAIFERMVPVFKAAGHDQFAQDLQTVVNVAKRKAEEHLDAALMP